MKVLGGVYDHYSGTIKIDGETVEIRTPADAKKLGIAVVHQEVDTVSSPT